MPDRSSPRRARNALQLGALIIMLILLVVVFGGGLDRVLKPHGNLALSGLLKGGYAICDSAAHLQAFTRALTSDDEAGASALMSSKNCGTSAENASVTVLDHPGSGISLVSLRGSNGQTTDAYTFSEAITLEGSGH